MFYALNACCNLLQSVIFNQVEFYKKGSFNLEILFTP
nr:MAG TPA: hypothetical protein [Caudoviricetes sp.]